MADDGTFRNWKRCPSGYFAEKQPEEYQETLTEPTGIQYTEQDILDAAKTFVSNELLPASITIEEIHLNGKKLEYKFFDGELRITADGRTALVTLSNGWAYQIDITSDDLAMQSLEAIPPRPVIP